MMRKPLAFAVVLAISVAFVCLQSDPPSAVHRSEIAAYVTHSPIVIDGDSDFTAANGVVDGNGNWNRPYVIEGWDIALNDSSTESAAITIANTTSYFIVRGVNLHKDGSAGMNGLILRNTTNGLVEQATTANMTSGVSVESSSDIEISGSSFLDSGVSVKDSSNIAISDSTVENHTLLLQNSSYLQVQNNTVVLYHTVEYPHAAIRVVECSNCTFADNRVQSVPGDAHWDSGILLEDSVYCTFFNNSLNYRGIALAGYAVDKYNTHTITANNSVAGLPILYYKNLDGVNVADMQIGQVIMVNCSGPRLSNLTADNVGDAISMDYVSNASVSDCSLIDTYATISLRFALNVNISENSIGKLYEIWIRESTNVTVANNSWNENATGSFSCVLSSTVVLNDNSFAKYSGQVNIASCSDVYLRGNRFPLAGVAIDADTVQQIQSTYVQSDNLVGDRPLLFHRGVSSAVINAEDYGQAIVADCSDISLSGLHTNGTSNCVQLLFVNNVTVKGCEFENGSSAIVIRNSDSVKIIENNFTDLGSPMHFQESSAIAIYHNNFFSFVGWSWGGVNYSIIGKIVWDNGYPDGGNYWGGFTATDQYSGSGQDVLGQDGIYDVPYDLHDLGTDRYPFVRPYNEEKTPIDHGPTEVLDVLSIAAIVLLIVVAVVVVYLMMVRKKRAAPVQPIEPQKALAAEATKK